MQLSPRYGSDPGIRLDGDPAAIAGPLLRQRRRLAEALGTLTEAQWEHPSRCESWSVRDVAVHLAHTNVFWEISLRAGLAGTPTQMLADFDPVASPAQMVDDADGGTTEVLDGFAASVESLAVLVDEMTPTDWEALAEAPPGHVSASAVAHHALWDSWIHERDMLLPLGLRTEVADDEVVASLRYVAALTPGIVSSQGGQSGVLHDTVFDVAVADPDTAFHVSVGAHAAVADGLAGADFTLSGNAVELLEALSFRGELNQQIPANYTWVFEGLAKVFDR